MAVPDEQSRWVVKSHLATAEAQSLAGRDIDAGGVKPPKHPALPRRDGAACSQSMPKSGNNTHDSPAPPVLQLPGPERIHHGWDASNVSTAKCDMCHRQRCGTIQKCSECKLSVCKECAYADLLQDDGRHVLSPEEVDWTKAACSNSRKMRPSRGGRGRGSRGGRGGQRGDRTRGQGRVRCRGGRSAQPQAASSRATSNSSSSTTSPRMDTVSLDHDGKWDEDRDWSGAERMPSGEAISLYKRPTKRARDSISRTASPAMDTRDVAQILVRMPGIPPNDEQGSLKRRKHSHQESPLDNVLPPVCSVPDPRQSGYLPSLRTIHPPLASDIIPLQPLILNRGLPPPRATPVAYMGHTSTLESNFLSREASHFQGNALFGAPQASRSYQYPPTAPHYYDSGGPAIFYNTPSLSPVAQPSLRESPTNAQTHVDDASFAGNSGQHWSRWYDERTPMYRSPPIYYPLEPRTVATFQVGTHDSPALKETAR